MKLTAQQFRSFKGITNANGLSSSVEMYIKHAHKKAIAEMIEAFGINTINQFCKFNFEAYEMSFGKLIALTDLQTALKKHMKKKEVTAKQAVAKVIKKQVAKRVATKVKAKKVTKAVAKKVTKKQSIKEKLFNQYKIVTQYSESLMQDIYSVVYRTKELKRFVNTNLANKYIEQEVLLKMNEHAVKEPKKIKGITKELKEEFETL
jgi:hypothetical protein